VEGASRARGKTKPNIVHVKCCAFEENSLIEKIAEKSGLLGSKIGCSDVDNFRLLTQ
jgi:tRNA(Phe) wybutosine-synthesizing methylase Tyw3